MDKDAVKEAVEDYKEETGDARAGPPAAAVAAMGEENSGLRKKLRAVEAELEALRKKEADQEEEKQALLIERVDKEDYMRVETQNKKLQKDIEELRV